LDISAPLSNSDGLTPELRSDMFAAQAYLALRILIRSLDKNDDADRTGVRSALENTNEDHFLETRFGRFSFDENQELQNLN